MLGSIAIATTLLLFLQQCGGVPISAAPPEQEALLHKRAAARMVQSNNEDDVITPTCDWKKQVGGGLYGEERGYQMGKAVAISRDGSTIAVGAPAGLVSSTSPGRVRLFRVSDDGGLVPVGKPIEGKANGDEAGSSVALSDDGTTVAVGSRMNSDTADDAGQTRVFKFDAALDDWVQVGQDIGGQAEGDYFGAAVAINSDGSVLAVGADGSDGTDDFDSFRGRVRVFQISDDNVWQQLGSDLDGLEVGDGFGVSVALSADGFTLVVGAPRSDSNGLVDSGEVAVYQYADSTWNQLGSRLGGEAEGDWFGESVATSEDGKTVAGGAWRNGSNGPSSGQAKVFTLNGSEWKQLGNSIIGEAKEDQAGYSVSLSADGRKLAVGAIKNDGRNGLDSGHVRVFWLQENTWLQLGRDLDGEKPEDSFGISVSISGDGTSFVAGGYGNDDNGIDAGSARVFSLDFPCPEPKEEQVENIKLTFIGLAELNDTELSLFEKVTEEWYEAYYAKEDTVASAGIRSLATTLRVLSQNVVESGGMPTNTLTYDQTFTFVDEETSETVQDILLRPFRDHEQVVLYVSLLTESSSVLFGNIQLPLEPPQLQSMEKASEGSNGLSKGAIAGIAVAALLLGFALACFCVLRLRRKRANLSGYGFTFGGTSSQLKAEMSNLPVGELVDMPHEEPVVSSAADATIPPAAPHAITVEVLDSEGVSQSAYKGISECTDTGPLPEYKDQVRGPSVSNSARAAGPKRSPDPLGALTVCGSEATDASGGPRYKDQVESIERRDL